MVSGDLVIAPLNVSAFITTEAGSLSFFLHPLYLDVSAGSLESQGLPPPHSPASFYLPAIEA